MTRAPTVEHLPSNQHERPPVSQRAVAARGRFIQYAAHPTTELRDQLVAEHLGLARQLAHRFANRGETYDDLFQVASLALIDAVDRFDPARGVEFSTFATHTIVGEIKRHFRDRCWAVRAPRRVQELYLKLGHISQTLAQSLGHSPTITELAQAAGTTNEAVIEALEAGQNYTTTSFDGPQWSDQARESNFGYTAAEYEQIDNRSVLGPALRALPPRQRELLQMRFFDGLTQREIANRVGLSQMHVSRLLATSLADLRQAFTTSQ